MSTEDEFERMWYPQNLNLVTKSIERDGEKKRSSGKGPTDHQGSASIDSKKKTSNRWKGD